MILLLEKASVKIDRFGWDRMNEALKSELEAEWCDVLSPYLLDEIEKGIRALFVASKGNLKTINEFQVEHQIKLAHVKVTNALSAAEPTPSRDNSPEAVERRRDHSASLGLKRMPSAQSEAKTRANINAAKDEIGE